MFDTLKTKMKINSLQKQIAKVEQRRTRSQGALVEAILTSTTPSDEDVDYFNRYTEEITKLRNEMHALQKTLGADA